MNTNLVAISGVPGQVQTATDMIRQSGPALDRLGGPLGLVGRVAGLGEPELRAGIPGWAWFGVGFMVGATAMFMTHDRVRKFMND